MKLLSKLSTKQLRPKAADTKWLGNEPTWEKQPEEKFRQSALGLAFNWYNYYFSSKDAKEMLVQYLETNKRFDEAALVHTANEKPIISAYGWLSRMVVMGLEINESEKERLEAHIKTVIVFAKEEKAAKKKEDENKVVVPKPNIQDHLQDKVYECAAEIDGMFDEFTNNGSTKQALEKCSPINTMRHMNISPNLVSLIIDMWQPQIDEYKEAIEGKCPQLVEGYSHVTKVQLKNWVKFGEQVIADAGSYVQVKKVERKPRRARPVSPEKIARRFKYLKDFPELKVSSESPVKLVNGAEAWLYNTKTRKLIHLLADSLAQTYSIKGASIIGFDPNKSVQKTLRKPAEQIKELLKSGKPAARKVFENIKATEVKFNGRSNENLMILKAW